MNNGIIFSIIVPVYNAKKYLKYCITSIIKNYIKDRLEVLLIDDGSKDDSGAICDAYSEKYEFIHTYHQQNRGAASARNLGVKKAIGQYVLFVDADDYIQEGVLQQVLLSIQNSYKTFYILKAYKVFDNGKKELINKWEKPENNYSKEKWIAWFSTFPKYPGSACDKMVERRLLTEHNIWFEEGRTAEDLYWVLQCIVYAKSYDALEMDYYYYRKDVKESVTNNISKMNLQDMLHAVSLGIEFANAFPKYRDYMYSMLAYEVEVMIYLYGKLDKAERQKVKDSVLEQKWLLAYRQTKRTKIIRYMLQLFGINGCTDILNTVRKIVRR